MDISENIKQATKETAKETTKQTAKYGIGKNFGRSAMATFIFLLIISGNYLGSLFPCKIQYYFENNLLLKHILGYFTLVFFVLLTLPTEYDEEGNEITKLEYLEDTLTKSFVLYLFFLILSKTPSYIWLFVFSITGLIYLLELKKTDFIKKTTENDKTKNIDFIFTKVFGLTSISEISNFQNLAAIIGGVITILGFFIYMGEKKYEYKGKFNYLNFFLGQPTCRNMTKNKSILNSIKHVFD